MADGSLYTRLETSFAEAGDKVLFQCPGGSDVTYPAFQAMVGRYANALVASGVTPGDRVMVQVGKSVEAAALYLASLKVGGVFNPLNTAYTTAELDYFMGDAEPRVLVVEPKAFDALKPVADKAGVDVVLTLGADGDGTLAELASGQSETAATVARDSKDLAALLYTSGTTGRSKGAMITHENLLSNAETLVDYWGFSDTDVLLHALPIFHVHGLFVALNTAFLSRASMIWMPKFDAATVLAELPKATAMMGVPTFYTRLLAEPDFGRAQTSGMRLFISGSAPLLAETHDAFVERTGHKILERYGMTEAGMITSNPYHDGERIAGTVGYALPGISVRIADDAGNEVANGEVGVLEVKGPNVFSGYWRLPEKTNEEFRADGYFVSGDLATRADDGRVTIVGRAKDLIISGGYNIYPKEIEVELNDLDGIEESAVIGVPHPDFGEGVVAVVTATDAANPPKQDTVLDALGAKLARFKLPKALVVVDTLPRNAMGKVQKNVLRDAYGKVLES
jgi:malonyl-CoA/methylmalonyl-CoA synthetase